MLTIHRLQDLRAEFARAGEVRTKNLLTGLAAEFRAEHPDDPESIYEMLVDCVAAFDGVDSTLIRETAPLAWEAALMRAVFVPLFIITGGVDEPTADPAKRAETASVERVTVLPRSARLYQTLLALCNEKRLTPHFVTIRYRDIAARLGYRRGTEPDSERVREDVRAAERDQILICLDPGDVRTPSDNGPWPIFCLRGSRETLESAALDGMRQSQYIKRLRRDHENGIQG